MMLQAKILLNYCLSVIFLRTNNNYAKICKIKIKIKYKSISVDNNLIIKNY